MHLRCVSIIPERFPTKDWYPFNLDIFHQTGSLRFQSPVTFFIGENGSGKSTFLKAVCMKCDIHIWENTERVRFQYNRHENEFHHAIDIEWSEGSVPGSYFSSQLFQNFSEILDEWAHADPGMLDYFGGKSLLKQSHGQSLLSFFSTRTQMKGLYLLDEPETALSPKNQIKLLQILMRAGFSGQAQFIIATHSPILLSCPDSCIYSFDYSPIRLLQYEETEHFRVYRDFLNDRQKYLERFRPLRG
jgi:predicted ATPase